MTKKSGLLFFMLAISAAILSESLAQEAIPVKPDNTAVRQDSVAVPFTPRRLENLAYKLGERFKYNLKYGVIKGAETEIAVTGEDIRHGRPVYHVEFSAKTVSPFDGFFKVDDRYETYIDKEGQYPHYFKQRVREGKYSRDDEVEFFHDKGYAHSHTRNEQFPMEAYAQDVLSSYFFVRTLKLKSLPNGSTIMMREFSEDKVYPLQVKILRRETIETEIGAFKTIVIEPLVQGAGLFKSEGKIVIWMTDDENKIPVKISIKVAVGAITAEISEMQGVRNPMVAKLED